MAFKLSRNEKEIGGKFPSNNTMNHSKPDYSTYSFHELIDVIENIDKEKYPERYEEVLFHINQCPIKRKLKLAYDNNAETCSENDQGNDYSIFVIVVSVFVTVLITGGVFIRGYGFVNITEPIGMMSVVVILCVLAIIAGIFFIVGKNTKK